MKQLRSHARGHQSRQRGFTMIETMIAIVIMSIGIITVLAAFGTAVAATQNAQENLIARQKALEAMESIYTSRNTQQITFAQIANISSGGIFTDGPTQLLSPGPDGTLGTPDDTAMSLANFSRQIQIGTVLQTDGTINPNLKQVTVTVSYLSGGSSVPHSYTVNALISAFR